MWKLIQKQTAVTIALLSVGIVLVSHIILLASPESCSDTTIRNISIMNVAAGCILLVLLFYPFMFVLFRGF